MMAFRSRLPLPGMAAALFLLAGCAGNDAGFPSLAPRPIERLSTAEPEAAPAVPQAADPAQVARYAAIVTAARDGDDGFRAALALARSAAARAKGSAAGSDAWIEAQQSLTRLDAARAAVGSALAALDGERTSGSFDPASLDAATAQVDAIDAQEHAAVDALTAALAGG